SGGRTAGTFDVERLDEGRLRFAPRGLPPGRYTLRPVGPLYGSPPTGHELTVLSPALRLEPTTVMRLKSAEFHLLAADGFDVSQVTSVRLQAVDAGRRSLALSFTGGRATLERGSFRPEDEGEYRVSIDGLHSAVADLEAAKVNVFGPRVE